MNLFAWYWLFVVVIVFLYTALMLWFMVGWSKNKYFAKSKKVFTTKVSVIVPFFNEEQNIAKCLEGILNQRIQTTEFKVIAINDHSTDNSYKIVENLSKEYNRLELLNANETGKKSAITQAVNAATSDLIVTTDADCLYNQNWLATLVDFYESNKPRMIIGPIFLANKKGVLNKFEQLEFNSLIMTTGGAAGIGHPIMCNGANLAFEREAFLALENPLNDKYLSGDDVFLLHNLKKENADDIYFIKSHDAAVTTKGVKGIKSFVNQRQRWVSKSGGYTDGDTIFTGTIVFILAGLFVVGGVFALFSLQYLKPLIFLFASKVFIDWLFFNQTKNFFNHKNLMIYIPIFQILYLLYVCVIGVSGLVQSRKWHKKSLQQ